MVRTIDEGVKKKLYMTVVLVSSCLMFSEAVG